MRHKRMIVALGAALIAGLVMGTAPPPVASTADELVLEALMRGDQALASADYAGLAKAVETLRLLGAQPVEGEEDLAGQWAALAKVHGASVVMPVYRGRALGPAYRSGALAGGATFAMQQLFLAGQRARISVAPGKDGLLSLLVEQDNGGKLCSKAIGAPQGSCDWMPIFTGRFKISVQNESPRPARFYLTVH